jgi:hypothetical protein
MGQDGVTPPFLIFLEQTAMTFDYNHTDESQEDCTRELTVEVECDVEPSDDGRSGRHYDDWTPPSGGITVNTLTVTHIDGRLILGGERTAETAAFTRLVDAVDRLREDIEEKANAEAYEQSLPDC